MPRQPAVHPGATATSAPKRRPELPLITVKMTRELLKLELATLSSDTLAYIDHCQYEVTGQQIRDVIESIMWDRYSTAGGAWPVSDAIPDDELGRPYKFQTVTYCAKASSPEDPAHQVARALKIEINGVLYGKPVGFICSCGERLGDRSARAARPRQRRVSRVGFDTHVWPRVRVDGRPFFAVCKAASSPVDLEHGPSCIFERCICGARFQDPAEAGYVDRGVMERYYRLWDAQ